MARGSLTKEIITKKILENFSDAFIDGKDIRIPMLENGEEVQIKVALTCAKDNVPHNGAFTLASDSSGFFHVPESAFPFPPEEDKKVNLKITEEEKQKVAELMEKLNL